MLKQLRAALVIFGVLTLITGVVYPLLIYAVAQTAMASPANGSIIEEDGKAVGSENIGQPFDAPKYFWGRPSATGGSPYSGLAGSGSNMGPTNPALETAVKERIEKLKTADPDNRLPVPGDLIYASASGLDPHISLEAAMYQVDRVTKARGLAKSQVEQLIQDHTLGPTMGVFGQQRVHVLRLNLALDKAK
jgi:potassium-transporting ATPase KdpC subunit